MTDQAINHALSEVAAGTEAAFTELYREVYRPVFLLAAAITRQTSLSEDIVQDVFTAVRVHADRYRKGCSGRAWIYAITRNVAYSYLRHYRKEISVEQMPEEADGGVTEDVLGNLVTSEALTTLNEAERAVVLLHVYNNMPLRAIADALQTPYGTIMWRYQSAKKKLRSFYGDRPSK